MEKATAMTEEPVDELMDRLVADYSDRRARGEEPDRDELLARVEGTCRGALEQCFAMIDAGLATTPTSAGQLVPGFEVAGYRIERLLGRGGMAVVYEATEVRLERRVALKVLRPALAADPKHVERFRREALAVARLQHPHIVQIFAVGEDGGHHFIAMELVNGPSLARAVSDASGDWCGGRDFERSLAAMMADVADGVAAAHELGIVHRDLKPSNILLEQGRRPKVADFGLAVDGGDPSLSLSGAPVGTPYYMSPEQVAQHRDTLDARTDVYSLGVTLYEITTGQRPFQGDTVMAVFDAIRTQTPRDVRALAPARSADLQAVVQRAMAKDRDERYPSAAALAADLRRLAAGQPTDARAREGGPVRRLLRGVGAFASGRVVEHRSRRTLLGHPLVHVNAGPRVPGVARRRACGWIAVGDVACGGVAIGKSGALGVISLGGAMGCGVISFGASLSVGLLALAGAAAAGGVALGGGIGAGYASFGGLAVGQYAMGGAAYGAHTMSGLGVDPEAAEWFAANLPWLMDLWGSLTRTS